MISYLIFIVDEFLNYHRQGVYMFGIGKCHHSNIANHVKTEDIKELSSRVNLIKKKSDDFFSVGGGLPWRRVDIKDVKILQDKLTALITNVEQNREGHNSRKELQLNTIERTLRKIEEKTIGFDMRAEAGNKRHAYINSPQYRLDREYEKQARKEKYS